MSLAVPKRKSLWKIPALFLAARLILFVAMPLEGLRGFGDLVNYYHVSGLGWPFLEYWVEYPPLFPWLSRGLYLVSAGQEHIYDYLLVLVLSCFQAATLAVFYLIAKMIFPPGQVESRTWVYFAILICLPYGWWYFDPIPELFMALGIYYMLNRQDLRTGISLALGTVAKLFPVLILPSIWRSRPRRPAIIVTSLTIGITILAYAVFYLSSPELTDASLRSQSEKGSWETVWALVDGNFNTGNFGPLPERYNPAMAQKPQGNPSRLPSYLTLIPFLALGGWVFWHARLNHPLSLIAFIGFTWCVFLVWSPGWSPQWVLYLLPLVLLTLPTREAILMAILLVFVNVLEWPVLLSRGYSWALWLTIPVRTLLLILLGYIWYRQMTPGKVGFAYQPAGLLPSAKDSL